MGIGYVDSVVICIDRNRVEFKEHVPALVSAAKHGIDRNRVEFKAF